MKARLETGATIPPWSGRRAQDALALVKAAGRAARTRCWICKQTIDYSLPSTDPNGCTVQHIKSRKLFPRLTWVRSNWAPAHSRCNSSEGSGEHGDDDRVVTEDF